MPNLNPDPFDTRVIERNLRDTRITRDQLKAHLDALPDESENLTTTEIRMESSRKPEQSAEQQ